MFKLRDILFYILWNNIFACMDSKINRKVSYRYEIVKKTYYEQTNVFANKLKL